MTTYSATYGLPCCPSDKGHEPVPLSSVRVIVVALGILALLGGVLALMNVSPFSHWSLPAKWVAVGVGGGAVLLGLLLKVIKKGLVTTPLYEIQEDWARIRINHYCEAEHLKVVPKWKTFEISFPHYVVSNGKFVPDPDGLYPSFLLVLSYDEVFTRAWVANYTTQNRHFDNLFFIASNAPVNTTQ